MSPTPASARTGSGSRRSRVAARGGVVLALIFAGAWIAPSAVLALAIGTFIRVAATGAAGAGAP